MFDDDLTDNRAGNRYVKHIAWCKALDLDREFTAAVAIPEIGLSTDVICSASQGSA